jgi:hypothetical protein
VLESVVALVCDCGGVRACALQEAEGIKVAIVRASKELPEDAHAPIDAAQKVREKVLAFLSKDLPLMTLLANPGIKDRHWEQMASTVGFELPHSEVRRAVLTLFPFLLSLLTPTVCSSCHGFCRPQPSRR